MSTIIINAGHWQRTTNGNKDTNLRKSFGEVGTVRVWYEGQQYVFGPGEQKSLDDGIASALVTADSRLQKLDTSMHAWTNSNASILNHIT
jgi:hypothetical protein